MIMKKIVNTGIALAIRRTWRFPPVGTPVNHSHHQEQPAGADPCEHLKMPPFA